MRESFIIAVDGPAGAGKGTLSKRLAAHYDLAHLDTGLLYRAVGAKSLILGNDLENEAQAFQVAQSLTSQDLLNPSLRQDDVANAASKIAQYPSVRESLVQYQRDFADHPPEGKGGAVLDGRDIGRQICPDAHIKLYLIADLETRAQRRFQELQSRQIQSIYEDVLDDMKQRDQQDERRKASPSRPAEDAIIIDTSKMGQEEVFLKACSYIEASPQFKAG